MQRGERDELFERIGQAAQVGQEACHLLVLGVDVRRQQPAQAEGVALDLGEGGALVTQGIVQQRYAARDVAFLGAHGSPLLNRMSDRHAGRSLIFTVPIFR